MHDRLISNVTSCMSVPREILTPCSSVRSDGWLLQYIAHLLSLAMPDSVLSFRNSSESETRSWIPVSKYDGGSYSRTPNSGRGARLEVEAGSSTNTRNNIEFALLEMRIRRALRRFQELIRQRSQRRCELRRFIVLRLEFLHINRRRMRAAIKIQRFIRKSLDRSSNTFSSRD